MGSFSDFSQKLNRIAARATPTEMRRARHAGLQPFVAAAKQNLAANGSNKTGKLSASLGIAEKRGSLDTSSAGPLKGRKHYSTAVLVEFGTAPHWQPNRFGGTMHPGARAKPFMRPAYDMTKAQIVMRAGQSLVQAIFRG